MLRLLDGSGPVNSSDGLSSVSVSAATLTQPSSSELVFLALEGSSISTHVVVGAYHDVASSSRISRLILLDGSRG